MLRHGMPSIHAFADEPLLTAFRSRFITPALLFLLAAYAAVYGATYAYLLHHLVNILAAWLIAIHFSTSTISLAGLSQMLEGDDMDNPSPSDRNKKRP